MIRPVLVPPAGGALPRNGPEGCPHARFGEESPIQLEIGDRKMAAVVWRVRKNENEELMARGGGERRRFQEGPELTSGWCVS